MSDYIPKYQSDLAPNIYYYVGLTGRQRKKLDSQAEAMQQDFKGKEEFADIFWICWILNWIWQQGNNNHGGE